MLSLWYGSFPDWGFGHRLNDYIRGSAADMDDSKKGELVEMDQDPIRGSATEIPDDQEGGLGRDGLFLPLQCCRDGCLRRGSSYPCKPNHLLYRF